MLDPVHILESAIRLESSEQSRRPIRQLSREFPEMDINDAYAIQTAWIDLKRTDGHRIVGHKIGLTSKAMQKAVSIDEPDYGVLLDNMSYESGAAIPSASFIAPRIEAELAFVLGANLSGPKCTLFDVLRATEYVTPCLEILDSRMDRIDPETKMTRKVTDTISDNAANAAFIIGGRPFRPLDVDLRWVAAVCFKNGQVEETGVAAGVLNHPATAVAWLANRLGARGVTLQAGEILLAGSFIRPIDVRAGDTIFGDYGAFGSVSCHFT